MADLQAYYSAVRAQKDELSTNHPDGYVHVTSIKDILRNSTAGTVTEVNLATAARHLVESTARISTEQEIREHKERGEAFAARMNAAEQRRGNQRFINLVQGPVK